MYSVLYILFNANVTIILLYINKPHNIIILSKLMSSVVHSNTYHIHLMNSSADIYIWGWMKQWPIDEIHCYTNDGWHNK